MSIADVQMSASRIEREYRQAARAELETLSSLLVNSTDTYVNRADDDAVIVLWVDLLGRLADAYI